MTSNWKICECEKHDIFKNLLPDDSLIALLISANNKSVRLQRKILECN